MPESRLSNVTSPYLQQHADNPVDWWPWCEEALELAAREDRPILLSIGYSACHWCHVMAHESFEDGPTAELMNRLFINIKVDREERPDLDRIYQNAHQLMLQRGGGWPLTCILSPQDHTPFVCGTYFPKEPRHGLPAFKELLLWAERSYREQGEEVARQNSQVRSALASLDELSASDDPLDSAPLHLARQAMGSNFDRQYGGLGGAPKFPHVSSLEWLLVHWADSKRNGSGDAEALQMVRHSLRCMAQSGINDQLGGGFYRYSVDERWEIPHFEKMLYDNGLLLGLYASAWQARGDPLFKQTALRTARWAMGEMQSPEGGFYSSLDADSEGVEGLYYVWTPDQLSEILDEAEYSLFAEHYGLNRPANFEGSWHLHIQAESEAQFQELGRESEGLLESARSKLLKVRQERVSPGRDEKVLTAWNALMIKGMARAARLLDEPELQDSAQRALDFIRDNLWVDGRLLASWRQGRADFQAYLDDYAFLLDGVLELLQLRWRDEDFEFAQALAEVLLNHFEDKEQGGLFFTSDDHEQLIQRPKPWTDDSMPSGNGVAALALARLGHLAAEPRYLATAHGILKAGGEYLDRFSSAVPSLLTALMEELDPPRTILLCGDGRGIEPWLTEAGRAYRPHSHCYPLPPGSRGPSHLAAVDRTDNRPMALVCEGTHCSPPVTELAEFKGMLG